MNKQDALKTNFDNDLDNFSIIMINISPCGSYYNEVSMKSNYFINTNKREAHEK